MLLKLNFWAIVVAAVAALVVGGLWYSPMLFGKAWMALRGVSPDAAAAGRVPVGELLAEFARSLVMAYVISRFVVLLEVDGWRGALQLGFWLWIGFNATLLLGSVIHESMPWPLYAIHAGHGLVNILVMAFIVGVWR